MGCNSSSVNPGDDTSNHMTTKKQVKHQDANNDHRKTQTVINKLNEDRLIDELVTGVIQETSSDLQMSHNIVPNSNTNVNGNANDNGVQLSEKPSGISDGNSNGDDTAGVANTTGDNSDTDDTSDNNHTSQSSDQVTTSVDMVTSDDSKHVTTGHGTTGDISASIKNTVESTKTSDKAEDDTDNTNTVHNNVGQETFNEMINMCSSLVDADHIYDMCSDDIRCLLLTHSLPPHVNLTKLIHRLHNLQELDVSNNNLRSQAFRAIIIALYQNQTVTQLRIANNSADTNSAECLGHLLSINNTLISLDVSGNYLGKDYFSRCVGPALKTNKTLKVLRFSSIGSTDLKVFTKSILHNSSLVEIDCSHNEIQDPTHFARGISDWLKTKTCQLISLNMRNMGLDGVAMVTMEEALAVNESLRILDLSANKVLDHNSLLSLLGTCVALSQLTHVNLADTKITTQDSKLTYSGDVTDKSSVVSINVSNCSLTDTCLQYVTKILQPCHLHQLDIGNNSELKMSCVEDTLQCHESSLERLSMGGNNMDTLTNRLETLKKLNYINIRKAKIRPCDIGLLVHNGNISTLVLDGLKLSGTDGLKILLKDSSCTSSMSALSLGGCALEDTDIQHISDAIKSGLPLTMLKLSANRISDTGVEHLVTSLKHDHKHPMKLIDLSNNFITANGASHFASLFKESEENKLEILNLSYNSIEPDGVESLVEVYNQSSLHVLYVNNQKATYEEDDMDNIFKKLTEVLGYTLEPTVSDMIGKCELPNMKATHTSIHLDHLEGSAGDLGDALDCVSIVTDYKHKKMPYLSFYQATQIAAALKGSDGSTDRCLMSSEEWSQVIGNDSEAPSWLQVNAMRMKALYMSMLPASITVQKLEGLLEMEVDCNVTEVYLMKDPVTRQNNGIAWALMADEESVQKAVDYFNSGQAQVFSQAFTLSPVKVHVDDDQTTEVNSLVRQDMERRLQERQTQETEQRHLIDRLYYESQERHAYRLAHPAYADGRIW